MRVELENADVFRNFKGMIETGAANVLRNRNGTGSDEYQLNKTDGI